MRLNNKGFAISTVLYSLLVMASLILFLLIGNLSFGRRSTSNFVNDIKDDLNNYSITIQNESLTSPELANNMIPVKYEDNSFVKADKSNENNSWYNYREQKWANAVTLDHSKVLDLSMNNNDGTIKNSTYLNGNVNIKGEDSEYVNCGMENYNFGNSITMFIRTKLNKFNGDNNEFFGNWEGAGGGISFDNKNKEIYAGFKLEGQNYIYVRHKISDASVLTSQYNNYVVTYDGVNIKLYFNGEEVASTSASGNIIPSSVPIIAGGNMSTSGNLSLTANLDISDILVFDRAISADEVKNYSENIDNVTNKNELLLQYNFDDNIPNDTKINMEMINTMWVWIPRYSYSIGSEDGTNYYGKQGYYLESNPTHELPGEVDIKFISKDTKEKGTAKYIVSNGIEENSWYTPDAFTFGDRELSGIWVGKFETSSSNPSASNGGGNTTSLDAMIKPNVTGWRNINISNAFSVSQKMNDNGNIYGFASNVDTHMMKNSEWAAISYLSQSRYGKLGNANFSGNNKEVYENKSSGFITGCSSGSPSNASTDYSCKYTYDVDINGTGASTTGNIYGVYDMSGSASEYVMGNFNGLIASSGFDNLPGLTYFDKYTNNDISKACNNGICISHGLLETSGWYNDEMPSSITNDNPWLMRGGSYNSGNSGLYYFMGTQGNDYTNSSFRLTMSIINNE